VGAAIVNKHAVAMKVDAPAYESCRKMAEQHQLQSILALPMVAQNGVIGVLVMYSGLREAFDTVNVNRYSIFSNRLALNLMLAQEHQKFRLVNAAMSKATQAIFITQHDGKIIWFNQALSDISGYSEQEIMDSTLHMFNSGSYEESFWQTILQGKVWTGDVLNRRKDGSLYNVFQTISPLHNNQNEINYFLCVQQDVSEKKELERKIEYLAYHDMLTGLPNRTLFYDRVEQAITQAKRDQTEFSLLFIDLDGFKEINDNHGHAAGDLVLKTVAERLRACVREGDTVARLGGDEFMVLLRDIHPSSDLKNVTQKILEHVALPYELGAVQAQVTVSIGVSNYPSDGGVVEKLISCADDAMYIAKRSGKNRYVAWRSQQHLTETSDWQI
jgi:diguanylate cyclase (GGDEF)-like protein/PAS domain S-box-containing protein